VGHHLRLRISLADRAGALAQASTVIGLHGGNIVSIDVHRTEGPSAVDDLIVEFPDEPDMGDIGQDLAAHAATELLDHQLMEPSDPVVTAFIMARNLFDRLATDSDDSLADAITTLCHSSSVWVTDEGQATRFAVGKLALESGQAVIRQTNDLPPVLATETRDDVWLAALAGHDRSGPRKVVFLSRPGYLPFTTTETQRIEALMSLYGAVSIRE
jgi:hypothetical protein